MKLFTFAMAVVLALALGGMVGFGAGSQHSAPQASSVDAPAAAPVEARVGAVGVLQAVNADSLIVQTREGMQVLSITPPAATDQLKIGDKVAIWAQNVDGRLVVRQIVVVPETPQRMHYLGLVSSMSGDRLDVVGQQGETTSFRIDATLQRMPDATHAPQVGDTVTVVAKPDPLGDGWLAVAIVTR